MHGILSLVASSVTARVDSEVTQVREGAYTPIEEYGIVGNLETCALVAPNGSVDWFPFPHVESPSILGAILDDDDGGQFQISPVGEFEGSQAYVDRTNVLETTFRTDAGTATVTDFLPPAGRVDHPKKVLYRKLSCTDGTVDVAVEYEPSSTTPGRRRLSPRQTAASARRVPRNGRW